MRKRKKKETEQGRKKKATVDARCTSDSGLLIVFFFLRCWNIVTNEKGRENSRDYIFFLADDQLFFLSLGDQTRHSLVQIQKKISEMAPKQGIQISKYK